MTMCEVQCVKLQTHMERRCEEDGETRSQGTHPSTLVDSQPSYVFLDCGESTLDIHDIFLWPILISTLTELTTASTGT